MKRMLIINPFGIGDVLFTAPVIKTLKDGCPDCFIGYWCNERVGDLLRNNPKIDRVFALSRGDVKRAYKKSPLKRFAALFKLINEIRKERFDIAFDLSLDSRYGLWSKLAGIKKRIGFDYKDRGCFLTDKIKLDGYSSRHMVEHNLDLLKFIDLHCSSGSSLSYKMEVGKEGSVRAKEILAEHGVAPTDLLIGVAPGGGASWGKDAIFKQWPAEKFGQLAYRLIKNSSAKVVLLGSADERPLTEIMGKMGQSSPALSPPASLGVNSVEGSGAVPIYDSHLIDLAGKLNLKELAAVISELKLLICNDGGLLHMAVALGVSTVSVFGPVDEKVYGPYPRNEKHIVVKRDLSCRPCYKDFKFTGCPNNRKCLGEITVDEVFEKVKSAEHH